MEIFAYQKKEGKLTKDHSVEDIPRLLKDPDSIVWIDIQGIDEQAEIILTGTFEFDPMLVQDAKQSSNHPKIQDFPRYLFFTVHGLKEETTPYNFVTKEIDGFLGENFLVTHHNEDSRSIEETKQSILKNPSMLHKGVDYLLYQILDRIIDSYISITDEFNKKIGEIEDRILESEQIDGTILEEIMSLKRSVARLSRIGSRQERVLYRLSHGEFSLIQKSNIPPYLDAYDHLLRVVALAESYRDLVNSLFNLHFNVITIKTNEAIKIMTIISTIMLPLSLIAGIYGMNFENMPELKTRYGYFVVLGIMLLIATLLLTYFWRKGWLFTISERKSIKNGKGNASINASQNIISTNSDTQR